MIRLKVHGGTLPDKRLCDTCRYSHIMKHADGTERIMCSSSENIEIRSKVVECNEFADRNQQSIYEMRKVGWILEMQGKQIKGFAQPKRKDDD